MSEKTRITPRPYQLELLEAAIEENTIVVLGTGAGKTFVSVLLIRELQYQILGSFSTHKRTIFLVTTVPLVAQQAKVIRNNLDVVVGEFKGDSKIDNWDGQMWLRKFEEYHVLVMTAQIFVNILSAGFIPLDKINLVIFDECHHATKDHPYSQVMRIFNALPESDQLPRVLGLTAALIQGKCRASDVETRITQLEKTLQCRAQTSQDLMTVQKYATRPEEHLIRFNSAQDDQRFNVFTKPIQFLAEFPKNSKSPTYDFVKDLLVDCSQVLEEVGSSILYENYIEQCLNSVESYRRRTILNTKDQALVNLCNTHLKMFKQQYKGRSGVFVTSKVKRLLQILEDFGIKNGESSENNKSVPSKDRLCGIIFVQQRSTALALAQMLKLFAGKKLELRYIKCTHIVGHGATQSQNGPIAKMADMTTAKQQEVLSQFRSHKINLLVSTSVVEEGLDVPQCNLVIRYSLPDDACSYLQSRGRARASNSQYIMMVDDKFSRSFDSQLSNMRAIEQMLVGLCHGRHVPVVDDDDDDDDDDNSSDKVKNVDEIIPPFCPHGEGTQIRATAASSIQLLYMYCQKRLPSDDFYQPVPVFKISKVHSLSDSMYDEVMNPDLQYQYTITMPISCPLLNPIVGRPMETAKLAKRDASVEVIRQLYDVKELSDNLLPVTNSDEEGDEDDSELQEEKKIVDAGTIHRRQKYKVQYAEALSECRPVTSGNNYLYMMIFHPANDKFPQGDLEVQSYGIITSCHLPLDDNDATLYHGNEELNVTMHRLEELIKLNSEELELITTFHYTLFYKILALNGAHLEADRFKSSLKRYVVIPITVLTGSGHMTGIIDYELMRKVVQNDVTMKWPCDPSEYSNTLVKVNHRHDIDDVTQCHRLYCVTKVCTDKSPRSPFPDDQWSTFQDFYRKKHNYTFADPHQPLLEVIYASNRLDHLTRRHSLSSEGEEATRKVIELFPEICDIHPLSAEMYKLARLLPSFLYRMESKLSARELITGVKLSCYSTDDKFTSPSPSLVLQALTLQGAQDSFNMERLELLGDTFLKMITTVSLHNTLPAAAPVRVLTSRRSKMFSNVRLYYLAKKKQIPSKMKATIFKARSMWLPPGYKLNDNWRAESEQVTTQLLPDKRVADCAEALIGAYIVAGGIAAGVRFLEWLGYFKTQHSFTTTNISCDSPSNEFKTLLVSNALGKYFSSPHAVRRSATAEEEKKLFAGLQKFNKLWKFQNNYLLVEAMTHISYTYNRVTSSYQRLELLGDAILDYLITSYIYCMDSSCDEGRVSLLRSAIVSNTTLAVLAVVNDFHKAVKHNSPKLFSKIQQFTTASADVVRQLKDHFQLEDVVHYESDGNADDGDEDVDTLDPPKVLADIVESLVGAVFLDSNKDLTTVWFVFEPLFKPFIEKFSRRLPVSPVRQLLETDIGGTATFRKQKCSDREVECVVKIKGKGIVVSATASTYKAAKKAASKKALLEL